MGETPYVGGKTVLFTRSKKAKLSFLLGMKVKKSTYNFAMSAPVIKCSTDHSGAFFATGARKYGHAFKRTGLPGLNRTGSGFEQANPEAQLCNLNERLNLPPSGVAFLWFSVGFRGLNPARTSG
jgi:hypothetical protein